MISLVDWLVNRIFRWDGLRNAVFDELMLYQSVTKAMTQRDSDNPMNLVWLEGNTWYGWTYNKSKKRYYFDDIGNESLMALWEDQWRREEEAN